MDTTQQVVAQYNDIDNGNRPFDADFFPEGVDRCSFKQFLIWMSILGVIFLWGMYAAYLVLSRGLLDTGLNNHFAFGAWITYDLAVIALGAGAFFTGFLHYILKVRGLDKIINLAVIVGFTCYTGALLVLVLEIGQPIRAWFVFWHANIHSMLTEVVYCISIYCTVLIVEYIPFVFENRVLNKNKVLRTIAHNLHIAMPIFAGMGAFLSTFHQGSLGGISGVMFSRPFFYRDGISVWPWTFFLFVISAAGVGPMFTVLVGTAMEKITKRKLIPWETKVLMAKITGTIFTIYSVFKIASITWWSVGLLPTYGLEFSKMFTGWFFGEYLLWIELSAIVPAILLFIPKTRANPKILYTAAFWIVLAVCINRYVQVIQGQAFPALPSAVWEYYTPTWVEWATCLMTIPYVMMILSISYRYMPIFPAERELNK
ncbi:MAG: menaquinone reductase integral membrane subunit QrcD [Desulfovibrionaceae bacterium]